MNEDIVKKAILTLEVLIDCCKEDGTYYNAQKEWEALKVFKQLQNNWNELKKYIKDRKICTIYDDFCKQILDKMQEMEKRDNKNEN